MKTWNKWIIPITLALVLVFPLSTLAIHVDKDTEVYKNHWHKSFTKGSWTHHEMYLQLLIEKYAPETAADWAPVLAEKKRLTEEMRAFYNANPDRAKKERKELRKQKNEEKDGLREQFMESHQRFDEAIQSKEEDKIKEALSEQFDFLKEHNKQLANRLAELKKE